MALDPTAYGPPSGAWGDACSSAQTLMENGCGLVVSTWLRWAITPIRSCRLTLTSSATVTTAFHRRRPVKREQRGLSDDNDVAVAPAGD
jgi:hypothetical protein